MIDTKRKAQGLVTRLKNNKNVHHLNPYTGNNDPNWIYIYSITGFFNGNYFAVYCFHHKGCDPHFEVLEHVTENIEELKKAFKL